ncbi:unnamed protein product [Knipowitschia caucasica]|uniref:Melanocortin-2 receptor accessory protein 2 n=1 Tax=Knipowitschia caucasica TaxID=637954 RepID=A0AAV2K947_KNICA
MTDFTNRSQSSARRSDYVWQYEYYDDEEPVSFEGLRAHRYSIVIGFWVGLAVFVIFMFFVLTLLTKTGAPHQDSSDPESCHRVGNSLNGLHGDNDSDKAFSRPLLHDSRSYFHFYISQNPRPRQDTLQVPAAPLKPSEPWEPDLSLGPGGDGVRADPDFTIPNFVNLEQASALGEELGEGLGEVELGEEDLVFEPSETLERQAQALHCGTSWSKTSP